MKDSEATDYHRLANEEFAIRKDYNKAIEYYTLAINEKGKPEALQSILLSNRAQCYILQKKYKLAMGDSVAATELDKTNAKAWYRLALSQFEFDDHEREAVNSVQMARKYAKDDRIMKSISELDAKVNQRLLDNQAVKYKHRRPYEVSVDYFEEKSPISLLHVVEIFNRHLHRHYHEDTYNFTVEALKIKGNDWFTRWHRKGASHICSIPEFSQSQRNNVHWKVRCSNNCTTFNLTLALALQDLLIDYKIPMLYDGALVTSIGVVQGLFMASKIKNPVLYFENGDISKLLNVLDDSSQKANLAHVGAIALTEKMILDHRRLMWVSSNVYIDLSGPQIDLYNYDSNGFPAFFCKATPYEIDLPVFTPANLKGGNIGGGGKSFESICLLFDIKRYFNVYFNEFKKGLKKSMLQVIAETIKEVLKVQQE